MGEWEQITAREGGRAAKRCDETGSREKSETEGPLPICQVRGEDVPPHSAAARFSLQRGRSLRSAHRPPAILVNSQFETRDKSLFVCAKCCFAAAEWYFPVTQQDTTNNKVTTLTVRPTIK